MKKLRFLIGKKEYLIILFSAVILILAWIFSGSEHFPAVVNPAKLARVAFAAIAVPILAAITWTWMNTLPGLKRLVDPDTFDDSQTKELSPWQKELLKLGYTFIAFGFYSLWFIAAVLIVSFAA